MLPPIAVGSPILKISESFFFSKTNPLKLIRTSWDGRVSAINPMIALGILANRVANAAPAIPYLNTIRNKGSNKRLTDTPKTLRSIGFTVSPCACFTEV